MAKTYKGELEQTLVKSEEFRKRVQLFEDRVRKIREELEKMDPRSPRYAELAEKKNRLYAVIDKFNSRIHSQMEMRGYQKEYHELPTIYKARNEIRHRLIRDHAIKEDIADVAATIKMTKGLDDRAAIRLAREILDNEIMSGRMNELKIVDELGEREIADETERNKRWIIADDILLNGESSKYLKRLNQKRNYI